MTTQKFWELKPCFKMFKNTYWGQFDAKENKITDLIISTRIILAQGTCVPDNMMKYVSKRPKYVSEVIDNLPNQWKDHIEVYKIEGVGYMIFSSPYMFGEDIPKELIELGWKGCPPIYSPDAKTIGFWCPYKSEYAMYNNVSNGIDVFINNYITFLDSLEEEEEEEKEAGNS